VHVHGLDASGWVARSHCRGWSVKDVVAHLSTDEVYNQACLDGTLDRLPSASGLGGWNARGVRVRRAMSPLEVLQEWEARQALVRRAWGELGLQAAIETSIGRYPLRLQVWHLAREYAIHADDIRVPVPESERRSRLRWRIAFGLFAAREEGDPVNAELHANQVHLRKNGKVHRLEHETFVAYLTNRPQQLSDRGQRALVRGLGATG
jgi:uncharacterized protein (TIGR03083 family)